MPYSEGYFASASRECARSAARGTRPQPSQPPPAGRVRPAVPGPAGQLAGPGRRTGRPAGSEHWAGPLGRPRRTRTRAVPAARRPRAPDRCVLAVARAAAAAGRDPPAERARTDSLGLDRHRADCRPARSPCRIALLDRPAGLPCQAPRRATSDARALPGPPAGTPPPAGSGQATAGCCPPRPLPGWPLAARQPVTPPSRCPSVRNLPAGPARLALARAGTTSRQRPPWTGRADCSVLLLLPPGRDHQDPDHLRGQVPALLTPVAVPYHVSRRVSGHASARPPGALI